MSRALCTIVPLLLLGPPSVTVRHEGLPQGVALRVEAHVHAEQAHSRVMARVVTLRGRALDETPVVLRTIEPLHQYELAGPIPGTGARALVVTVEQGRDGEHGVAEALVHVAADGTIREVTYPRGRWYDMPNAPRRATTAELRRAAGG